MATERCRKSRTGWCLRQLLQADGMSTLAYDLEVLGEVLRCDAQKPWIRRQVGNAVIEKDQSLVLASIRRTGRSRMRSPDLGRLRAM